MSLKDQILAADDLPREEVPCPEWNCSVFIKSLTGRETVQYEKELIARRDLPNPDTVAVLLAATVCDADGNLIFTYEDTEALVKKNGKVIRRLFTVANRLNPLFGSDIEVAAKNSVASP